MCCAILSIANPLISQTHALRSVPVSYVIRRLEEALDARFGLSLGKARILIIGLAYKKKVSDIRESPSLKLMELLEKHGSRCDYHDPHVPVIPSTREHAVFQGQKSVALNSEVLAHYDVVLISTDHDAIDYALLVDHAPLIVDTRNVFFRKGGKIIKA